MGLARLAAALLIGPFLLIDLTFLGANLLKVHDGGWVPLALGGLIMVLMYTWRRGSRILFDKTRKSEVPLKPLVGSLEKKPPVRVPGTAVFLTSDPGFRADRADAQPQALQGAAREERHPDRGKRRHAACGCRRRVQIEPIGDTFSRVVLRFGFMETPNVPKALAVARKLGWTFDIMSTSFFLSRRTLKPAARPACRGGRTGCSSCWRTAPMMRPTISRSRPNVWWRWARRSRCESG